MKWIIDKFLLFIETHSWAQGVFGLIGAILFLVIIALIINWFKTPIEFIYKPNAPIFPCSLGGCD